MLDEEPDGQEPEEDNEDPRVKKANSEAAKYRTELRTAQAELKKLQEAGKTETEKEREARVQAEKDRDDARLALLKRDAAEAAGLPRAWADRLHGSTKEELEADAKDLAKALTPEQRPTATRPVADLKPGALPAGEQTATDVDSWIRDRARRR